MTIPSTPAGRAVVYGNDPSLNENDNAKLARKRAEAQRAADALNAPQDAPAAAEQAAPAKPSATFTIHGLMDDFPFDVAFVGSVDQFRATVKRLRDAGAVPPTPAARAAVEAERERSAPACNCDTCDRYGQGMKESSKAPGTWYCPGKIGTKNGQPLYCKSKG